VIQEISDTLHDLKRMLRAAVQRKALIIGAKKHESCPVKQDTALAAESCLDQPRRVSTKLKIILPSIIVAIKIWQYAPKGDAVLGIVLGTAAGSLAIVIIWGNIKLFRSKKIED
jgi:hypothetical protein